MTVIILIQEELRKRDLLDKQAGNECETLNSWDEGKNCIINRTLTAPHKQGGFLIPETSKMDNKKLPLVEELKSIVFDFEHGKYTVNNS